MFGLPIVDYNKLKLAAYYIGHKFHDESIKELYLLSKTASDIFPMAKIVGDFYSGIEHKFYAIGQRLSRVLGPDNLFASNLEGKALKTYSTANPEIQAKMIINAGIDAFDVWIKNLVAEYYPTIATTDLDSAIVKSGLRRVCMDLKPWLNYEADLESGVESGVESGIGSGVGSGVGPSSNSVLADFRAIIANPTKYLGIGSVFLMLMHQEA